jgi:hypothetical protein
MKTPSLEEAFLERLARGGLVSQDEYDQTAEYIDPAALACALAQRFSITAEIKFLVEAARLYLYNGQPYHALEACSRAPRARGLQPVIHKALEQVRGDYPDARQVGKLMEEAFLIIDLETGQIARFPPLLPSRA